MTVISFGAPAGDRLSISLRQINMLEMNEVWPQNEAGEWFVQSLGRQHEGPQSLEDDALLSLSHPTFKIGDRPLERGLAVIWRDPDAGLATQQAVVVEDRGEIIVLTGRFGSEIEAMRHEIELCIPQRQPGPG